MPSVTTSPDKEIMYLFRFRDLVAPTLDEHRRIIDERGKCWWGWWKRPAEERRLDVWQALKNSASTASPVPVGLFDSGTDKVYRAWVTDVVLPKENDGRDVADPLPAPQEELVPSYYRQSPFSRAWMKIVEIEPDPVAFFGNYSYSSVPAIPHYSKATLEQFRGKVILSAEELRNMDTTIWNVRPKEERDLTQQILLGIPGLGTPISRDPVRCNADTILHITDLHFSVGKNRKHHCWGLESEGASQTTMADAVLAAVGDRKVGLIIVTGDLTFTADPAEFKDAITALHKFIGRFGLTSDHVVVVPGNHDVKWTNSETYEYGAKVVAAPEDARANYSEFYRTFFRHEPNRHLSMGRRFTLPCGLTLELCGLNSSTLDVGKDFLAGMGRIDEAAFTNVAAELGWNNDQTLALRMLAIHHHLALTEDLEQAGDYYRGFGIAMDAVRIQRMAAKKNVQLALHGHKHRSFIWRSSVYELPEHAHEKYRLGDISIIGGGSSGSNEVEAGKNFFNLISFGADGLQLDIYQSRNSGLFEVMQTWYADIEIARGSKSLVLREWRKKGEI